jgi:hypothetical protein
VEQRFTSERFNGAGIREIDGAVHLFENESEFPETDGIRMVVLIMETDLLLPEAGLFITCVFNKEHQELVGVAKVIDLQLRALVRNEATSA